MRSTTVVWCVLCAGLAGVSSCIFYLSYNCQLVDAQSHIANVRLRLLRVSRPARTMGFWNGQGVATGQRQREGFIVDRFTLAPIGASTSQEPETSEVG